VSVFAVEHTPGLRLVRRRPGESLDEVGLRPDLTIEGVGRKDGHLNSAFGRNAAARIHDVRVTVSADSERSLVAARSGERQVFEVYLRCILAVIPGVGNADGRTVRSDGEGLPVMGNRYLINDQRWQVARCKRNKAALFLSSFDSWDISGRGGIGLSPCYAWNHKAHSQGLFSSLE